MATFPEDKYTRLIEAVSGAGQPLNSNLTSISLLADPNADRILFWDDSAGAFKWLAVGTNLTITGTTLDATGGGGGDMLAANNLSDLVNKATARTNLGVAIGVDVQAYDADLTTWAGITPGTGVGAALAVNVGSAGAFVTFNGAGGTPSSLTLTNATGLPASGLVASTTQAVGFGSVELGHASDTTLSRSSAGVLAVEGVVVPTISSTNALTNKDLTSGTNTFPTFNQNTTGSAAKWTTARNLAGNSVDGSANVQFANKFIVQGTADTGLSAAQFLGALGTGIVKNTTTTGVLSIAVAADFPTLNQSTTGSAATLTTSRNIYGNNFDGSAALTQIIASTYGGTGNGFTKFSGPATAEKTFTLPNATATILTDNAAVTVAQGGTGRATSTTAYGLIAAGTTATGAHQTLAAGATTEILVGGGASALPVWTTATGSGAPVRATSPSLVTPALGVATATSLTTSGNVGVNVASPSYNFVVGEDLGSVGSVRAVVYGATAQSFYTIIGQSNTRHLQYNWIYNATVGNAYAELVTFGYGNPLKINVSALHIGDANPLNVKIGGTASRATTEGTNQLVIFNGTAPAGTLANGASLSVTAGEMRVWDSGGTATLISPHDEENYWVFDSEDTTTGEKLHIDVEKLLRFVNDHFGLDFVKGNMIRRREDKL